MILRIILNTKNSFLKFLILITLKNFNTNKILIFLFIR